MTWVLHLGRRGGGGGGSGGAAQDGACDMGGYGPFGPAGNHLQLAV